MIIKEDKWSAFGHYEISDGSSHSPCYNLRIAHEQISQGKKVTFNFHNQLFDSIDTRIEPDWTLDYLYSRRVEQLRNKYDYLVLLYSGGADSNNVLRYFQHTDTKLDEIVCYDDSSYMGQDSSISSEIFKSARPEVTRHLELFPDTTYRPIAIRDVQTKLFTDAQFKFDPYMDITYNMQPMGIKHAFGLCYVDKYKELHSQGLKVGVIHGIDKPRPVLVNGKWHMYFSDWSSQFGHKHYYRDFPFYDEFFYWTPDDPRISIKQSHVIKNKLDQLDAIHYNPTYRLDQNTLERKSGNRINWEFLNSTIYPFWNTDTYSWGKNKENFIASSKDFTLNTSADDVIINYKKSIIASLQLAAKVKKLLTTIDIGNTNIADSRKPIGIAPMRSKFLPLE